VTRSQSRMLTMRWQRFSRRGSGGRSLPINGRRGKTMNKTKRRKRRSVSSACSTVPIIVYRMQDKDGRGPWKPGFSESWTEDRDQAEYAALRPMFQEFPGLLGCFRTGKHYGCGCTSLEQLRRWIRPNEYARLRRFGYQCVAVEVERVLQVSDVQCVFERSKPLRKGVKVVKLHP